MFIAKEQKVNLTDKVSLDNMEFISKQFKCMGSNAL